MKFKVEPEIFEKFPRVRIGVLVILGMDNTRGKEKIAKLLAAEEEKKKKELVDIDLKKHSKIAPWREIYQKFGSKPRKYRSSVEALLRRVLAGNKLPRINPLVDLYNCISIKHMLPAGAEDLDRVKGDIVLGFAKGDEEGKYINSDEVSTCYKGEVIYKDSLGFICRRWNWREGDRTKLMPESKNAVVVIEANPNVSDKEFQLALNEAAELIKKYLRAKVRIRILDAKNTSFDIDFEPGKKLTKQDLIEIKEAKEVVKEKKVEKVLKQKWIDKSGLAHKIAKLIYKAAVEALGKRAVEFEDIVLEHPVNPDHGDYSTNIALQVKKKDFPTPVDLANKIVNTWRSLGLPDYIEKIEVAKPGFINIWLKNGVLSAELQRVLKEKDGFGKLTIGKGKTVIIDYSSPNIAKPFGVGHLRSTIIGQAIYNIYKFLGWETVGDNHLGDWGTQFGKLIVAIKKWNKGKVKGLTIKELEKLYVKFHQEAAKNPKLDDEARAWFKKLEDGDSEAKKIWKACVQISIKEFQRIYDLLGVKIDYTYGESFYQNKMKPVIEEAKRKKVAVESEGALVIKFPELNMPPAIILKSDGATTYETRDLACIKYRKKRWKPDLYIYEVGVEQSLHFQQTFAAAVKLGCGQPEQFVHVGHGLIRLPSGKLSTRKGKIIHLEDVLEEAIKRAGKIIQASETDRGLGKREQEAVAQVVGVGAVKYFDLMHHYSTDIIFDWEKMFVLEGNSAPYLQYTYARCQSVLRKATEEHLGGGTTAELLSSEVNTEELALLRTIYKFPEVIREAGENFAPNLICNFLFDLAQKYNLFYNKHPILKAETPELVEGRLALTTAVGQVIKNGLTLLGIKAPERM